MSGVAALPDPIAAEHIPSGMPVLITAWYVFEDIGKYGALYVDDEGLIKLAGIDDLRTNWRYDHATHEWTELDGELGPEDEDGEAPPDDAPDGSPAVSGSVPEVDPPGEGDPSSGVDGDTGDLDAFPSRAVDDYGNW